MSHYTKEKQSMSKFFTNRVAKNGKRKLILSKGITLQKDGVEIELDQYRMAHCIDAVESIQRRQESGNLDSEKATKLLDYINDKNIKFDVVIPPASQEE